MSTTLPFGAELTIIDRSTLEAYATCPAQAAWRESGDVQSVGEIAVVGTACHDAISTTLRQYVDSQGVLSPREIRADLDLNAMESRPDVQPGVLRTLKYGTYLISEIIGATNWLDIISFDGGEGKRSGQLAFDFESLGLRYTSEVDFLRATISPSVLEEWDWKTGRKKWTETDILDSFQFQSHWFLVANTFRQRDSDEPLEALDVRILNTLYGKCTYNARFTRDMLPAIKSRIQMAAQQWYLHRHKKPEDAETWPTREKCRICDAAAMCRICDSDVRQIITDPGTYLETTMAIGEHYDARKTLLGGVVEKTGKDIVSEEGNAYGFQKPTSTRKPAKSFYVVKDRKDRDV
jgi:hypothetical protein